MIKIEKRLMAYCEDCDDLQPCTMKLRMKNDNNEYYTKIVVMCQHADVCDHAVHQYQKTCESKRSPCETCAFKIIFDTEGCDDCKLYSEWREKHDD